MDKAEIEKILEELISRGWFGKTKDNKFFDNPIQVNEAISKSTSSLTALIIKWLEGKMVDVNKCICGMEIAECNCVEIAYGRNQLITELIGEVNQ